MRRTLIIALLVLVPAACSIEETSSPDRSSDAIDTAIPSQLVETSVIGSGRAVLAGSATGDGAVIATTIGVNVVRTDGNVTAISHAADNPVSALSVSPDGRYTAIEGRERSEIWSVDAVPTLVTEFPESTRVLFTDDSSTIVTSSRSRVETASVTETPQTVITAPPGTELGTATMTPDGEFIAVPVTGAADDLITYAEATGTTSTNVFAEPEQKVSRADFSSRSDRLVLEVSTGDSFDAQLVAWDALMEQIVWETAPGDFSPGSAWDVDADGRVLTADGSTLRLIGTSGTIDNEWQLGETRWVTAITATGSGFALALSDGTLLLTAEDGEPSGPSVSVGRQVADLSRLAGTAGAITVDATGVVQTWNSDGIQIDEITSFRAGTVNDVDVSADGASIAAASIDGMVMITDPTGSESRVLEHPEGDVDSVAFSVDGARVVTGVGERLSDNAFDDTVSLWDLGDGVRIARLGGDGEEVIGCANFRNIVAYSPSGDLFASTSHDFTVSLHAADSGEILAILPPHVSTVLDLEFSPTGDRLVTSSDDGAVRVWSVETNEILEEFVGPPGGYWSIGFMPDGERLVVGDLTGALRMISVADGNELMAFEGTTSRSGRPAVSPDGSIVAAPVEGNAVGLWSTDSGQLVLAAKGHREPVTAAVFSADGSMLVTGSIDATVRTWSVESG
jgi:WD40 repeat protein